MNLILLCCLLFLFWMLIIYGFKVIEQFAPPHPFYVDFYVRNFNRMPDIITARYLSQFDENGMEDECHLYFKQVKIGQHFVSSKKIILCGLLRNGEQNIGYLKKFYGLVKNICSETRFLIVENNSRDHTRGLLLEWAKMDPSIIILCDEGDPENKESCHILGFEHYYVEKIPDSLRIKKLAHLRNVYIDYIKHHQLDVSFDYFIVADLDLKGELYMDGLFHSFHYFFTKTGISAIACNGLLKKNKDVYEYYDSFAYVQLGEDFEWNFNTDKQLHDEDVLRYITEKYTQDMSLDRVLSAFGGFCIYDMNVIRQSKNARYHYSANDKLSCEHVHLHLHLKKMYVNPRMIFLIHQNP